MTKIATRKTAGVLGDELAVGAEKASGYSAAREPTVEKGMMNGYNLLHIKITLVIKNYI